MPTTAVDTDTARRWPPYAGRPGQACTANDADAFYPSSYHGTADYTEAKAICRRCELVDQCRAWALATRQQHGLWGGLTPAERRAVVGGPRRRRYRRSAQPGPAVTEPLVCNGRDVDRQNRPAGPACGRQAPERPHLDPDTRMDALRASGWRIGPVRPGGSRDVMCPKCARPDPALTRLLREL